MDFEAIFILCLIGALIVSLIFNMIQDSMINQRDGYIQRKRWSEKPDNVPDTCPHGRGWHDYCEPCGRINSA